MSNQPAKADQPVTFDQLRQALQDLCDAFGTIILFADAGCHIGREYWMKADEVLISAHAILSGRAAAQRELWRHIKTGNVYEIIGTAIDEKNLSSLTIYQNVQDGTMWARPTLEFNDGRFVKVGDAQPKAAQPTRETVAWRYLTHDEIGCEVWQATTSAYEITTAHQRGAVIENLCVNTAVPEPILKPSKVFCICNAYESGYGHGLARDGLDISKVPHGEPAHAEAYQLGYEEGLRRSSQPKTKLPNPVRCNPHPEARHRLMRGTSGRYVCECQAWVQPEAAAQPAQELVSRDELLEEAAKVCDQAFQDTWDVVNVTPLCRNILNVCSRKIRGLKSTKGDGNV